MKFGCIFSAFLLLILSCVNQEVPGYTIGEHRVGNFLIGSKLPTKIKGVTYEIFTETRDEEGVEIDYRMCQITDDSKTLLLLETNDTGIIRQINVFSEKYITEKLLHIGSLLTEFCHSYPEYKIWYSYVLSEFVFETKEFPNTRFIIDSESYIGKTDINRYDQVFLKLEEFNNEARITEIQIW
ncbi:MAG: hypothetical protein Q7J16_01935 [Candidatus Cloacimonadales bacterium]|nr:hypothetical protein [Candidatus Cloacimonadales bacterium]